MTNKQSFYIILAAVVYCIFLGLLEGANAQDYIPGVQETSVNSLTCDELLNSCEEAVISQEATIEICEDISAEKTALIETVKENAAATEKSLSNQKVATTTGFSLSTLLLLLLIL